MTLFIALHIHARALYCLLPALSVAVIMPVAAQTVALRQAAEFTEHLVLSLEDNVVQLHTQQGVLLSSQPQTQTFTINYPEIKSLTLDFRSGLFEAPVVYQGNQQQDAQLIIQGGDFPVLNHVLHSRYSGYLDFNQDGQADLQYDHVAEVHLYPEPHSEIYIQTPRPHAPTRFQRVAKLPLYRISSGNPEPSFATTVFPAGYAMTLQAPPTP